MTAMTTAPAPASARITAQGVLTGALAVQILLAAIVWWPRGDATVEARPLIPFTKDEITGITIESTTTRSRNQPLELVEQGDGWVVHSEYDYPAQTPKVEELLDKLVALRIKRPIATQSLNHAALNVDAAKASRAVKLTAGDRSIELYAGTASGSRMNVRVAGDDAVYEVTGMGAWSIREFGSAYYDTEWLDVDPTTLQGWSLTNAQGTVELTRDPSGVWTSAALAPGELLDPEAVEKVLSSTLKLAMNAPADPAATGPDGRSDSFVLRWTAEDPANSGEYTAFPAELGVVARRASDPRPVTVTSQFTRDALEKTTLAALLPSAPPTDGD